MHKKQVTSKKKKGLKKNNKEEKAKSRMQAMTSEKSPSNEQGSGKPVRLEHFLGSIKRQEKEVPASIESRYSSGRSNSIQVGREGIKLVSSNSKNLSSSVAIKDLTPGQKAWFLVLYNALVVARSSNLYGAKDSLQDIQLKALDDINEDNEKLLFDYKGDLLSEWDEIKEHLPKDKDLQMFYKGLCIFIGLKNKGMPTVEIRKEMEKDKETWGSLKSEDSCISFIDELIHIESHYIKSSSKEHGKKNKAFFSSCKKGLDLLIKENDKKTQEEVKKESGKEAKDKENYLQSDDEFFSELKVDSITKLICEISIFGKNCYNVVGRYNGDVVKTKDPKEFIYLERTMQILTVCSLKSKIDIDGIINKIGVASVVSSIDYILSDFVESDLKLKFFNTLFHKNESSNKVYNSTLSQCYSIFTCRVKHYLNFYPLSNSNNRSLLILYIFHAIDLLSLNHVLTSSRNQILFSLRDKENILSHIMDLSVLFFSNRPTAESYASSDYSGWDNSEESVGIINTLQGVLPSMLNRGSRLKLEEGKTGQGQLNIILDSMLNLNIITEEMVSLVNSINKKRFTFTRGYSCQSYSEQQKIILIDALSEFSLSLPHENQSSSLNLNLMVEQIETILDLESMARIKKKLFEKTIKMIENKSFSHKFRAEGLKSLIVELLDDNDLLDVNIRDRVLKVTRELLKINEFKDILKKSKDNKTKARPASIILLLYAAFNNFEDMFTLLEISLDIGNKEERKDCIKRSLSSFIKSLNTKYIEDDKINEWFLKLMVHAPDLDILGLDDKILNTILGLLDVANIEYLQDSFSTMGVHPNFGFLLKKSKLALEGEKKYNKIMLEKVKRDKNTHIQIKSENDMLKKEKKELEDKNESLKQDNKEAIIKIDFMEKEIKRLRSQCADNKKKSRELVEESKKGLENALEGLKRENKKIHNEKDHFSSLLKDARVRIVSLKDDLKLIKELDYRNITQKMASLDAENKRLKVSNKEGNVKNEQLEATNKKLIADIKKSEESLAESIDFLAVANEEKYFLEQGFNKAMGELRDLKRLLQGFVPKSESVISGQGMWEKSVSIKSKGKKKQKDAKEVEVDYVKLLNDVKSKLLSYEDLLAKKDQFKKEEVSQAKLLERCKKELIEVQKQRSHLESLLRVYEEKEFSIK